jgi:hypothetical protein
MVKSMKKLCATLALSLLFALNPINAKEAKTLYDLYRIERERFYPNPLIHYLDEPTPNNFIPLAQINQDHRDSVDLMLQILQDTPAQNKTVPFWDTREFGFCAGVATAVLIMYAVK